MSKQSRKGKPKLKTFGVAYCVEQGFSIEVQAISAEEAERIIEERLDDECNVLSGSTRVHYDGFTAGADEREEHSSARRLCVRAKAGAR
jgi:hypothetical protein